MTDPTSADPDALGRFGDTSGRLRAALSERAAEFDGLVRWVESGSADFGVPGMAALVDRVAALAVQWELSEACVAGVRDALVGADLVSETSLPPRVDVVSLVGLARAGVVDDLAADLVGAGMTEALAAMIAADTIRLTGVDPSLSVYEALRRASAEATGVSEEELDRRGRAFGLRRSAVAATVLAHLDEVERASGGYGHGVTLAGLRAVADDERAPSDLRDAAYRLASDPGLFNDLDSAARTKGLAPTGYDWSETDGVVGRSDLDGFARRDGRMRAVLPWRLLLDTASDGFRLDGADGIVRARDVERFVHDRRVPASVRQAAWELYAESDPELVRGLDPFEPDDGDGGGEGGWLVDAAGRSLVGGAPMAGRRSWLASGSGGPRPVPGGPAAPGRSGGGPGGAGFAGLVAAVVATALEPAVDAGVDAATGPVIAAWDRARAEGMPSTFVVFDPLTGQPVALDSGPLTGLSGDEAVAAVFWAAASGHLPGAGPPPEPVPADAWIDEHGVWRDGVTNRPLAAEPAWAPAITGGTDAAQAGSARWQRRDVPAPQDPYQYTDGNGDVRWVDTNQLVSQQPNRNQYEDADGIWRWSDTDAPVGTKPEEVRGEVSARAFNPAGVGGPIERLDFRSAIITAEGVGLVVVHLGRFEDVSENVFMVGRLEQICDGRLDATDYDLRFYTHELRELSRYRTLGVPDGVDPGYDLWNDVHTAALEDYGIADRDETGRRTLYHPDAPFEEQ